MASTTAIRARAKYRDGITGALTKGGVRFRLTNPRSKTGTVQIEIENSAANVAAAMKVLVAVDDAGWAGSESGLVAGGAKSIGSLFVSGAPALVAAASSTRDPAALVAAYATEADQLRHWRAGDGADVLPTGPTILGLDKAGRVKAVVEAYRLLPTDDNWKRRVMLSVLAVELLKPGLPLAEADFSTILEHAASAFGSAAHQPDFEYSAVAAMQKSRVKPTVVIKAALRKIIARRSVKPTAADRKVCDACSTLMNRG